ncbi:septum-promoting GTP-binding protein 1 [Reticulomyxa filosa]|uniref:Septum-promoting GTP-binding protein 1 n=1 Tax=Reticulomyxa filosa TaxID=46433 RepID=X6MMF9_RETFI|nr:septum-promoting GTP-binding protein 1 [Reticulomyxa filosa]|eukprot:ETO14826.1 septum-promoting GTP-binding protein 1 [Reticulomyxa filosa]
MEKIIHLKNVDVDISIWDLGGQKNFSTLIPLVCSKAKLVLFAFDLTSKQSLHYVKIWYKEARKENKVCLFIFCPSFFKKKKEIGQKEKSFQKKSNVVFMASLIGTKYDLFDGLPDTYKQQLTTQAQKFDQKMHATLMYCSSVKSINVAKIAQVIDVIKVFNMDTKVEEFHNELTEPILEYNHQVV